MVEVEVTKRVLNEIRELCRHSTTPSKDEDKVCLGNLEEVCGVLVGKTEKNRVLIDEFVKTKNVAKSAFLFEISPYDLYNAYINAQKRNKEVVGVFHSHPHGSSNPSRLDIKGIKETGLVWIIVGDEIKAFKYDNKLNKIIELKIKVK